MKKERMENAPLLKVEDLSVSFHMYDKGLEQYDLKVISNLSLDVKPGGDCGDRRLQRLREKPSGPCCRGNPAGECQAHRQYHIKGRDP